MKKWILVAAAIALIIFSSVGGWLFGKSWNQSPEKKIEIPAKFDSQGKPVVFDCGDGTVAISTDGAVAFEISTEKIKRTFRCEKSKCQTFEIGEKK